MTQRKQGKRERNNGRNDETCWFCRNTVGSREANISGRGRPSQGEGGKKKRRKEKAKTLNS